MIVKADFHAHTSLDPVDDIKYSPFEYIDAAAKKKFKVLSLTHHKKLIFTKEIADYGKSKGILIIPGFEATIQGQDVVILNPTTDNITTWEELAEEKAKGQCLTILAHPFWYIKNLIWTKRLDKYAHLFDAVEICWFQTKNITFANKLARKYAKKHSKPLVGTGDIHKLDWIGNTYSKINVKKLTIQEIFQAIRKRKAIPVQNNISNAYLAKIAVQHLSKGAIKKK